MLPTMNRRSNSGLRRLSDLRDEMDRLFEDVMGTPTRSGGGSVRWRPAADILESDEGFEIALELPGFHREDIEVTVEEGVLTVSGRRDAESHEGQSWHLRERPTGRFSRSFSLPASVKAEEVTARFEDGVLRVRLPKEEEARTRKIEVDVA